LLDANLFAINFISQFQLIVNIESALIDAHRTALAEPGLSADQAAAVE